MTVDDTLAVGDTVVVRNVAGWWKVVELRLVADEVVVQRYKVRRIVPALDVSKAWRGENR